MHCKYYTNNSTTVDVHGPIKTRCDTTCTRSLGRVDLSTSVMNDQRGPILFRKCKAKTHKNEYGQWKGYKIRFGKTNDYFIELIQMAGCKSRFAQLFPSLNLSPIHSDVCASLFTFGRI